MAKIKNIKALEILDSRGNPTLKVVVELENGIEGWAAVPSGASTGAFEAVELRDNDKKRYQGLGVLTAVKNVNEVIAKILKGYDCGDQEKIDDKMREKDGTENKSELGANAILGVSLAVCRAAAKENKLPLYKYLAKIYKFSAKGGQASGWKIPIPMFNVLNGGKHSDSGLSIQEFMVIPTGIKGFPEQLRAGSEIFHTLKDIFHKNGYATAVGDEGGFAPMIEGNMRAIEVILKAVRESNFLLGAQINLGLDVAANSFYQADEDQYLLKPENVVLKRDALVNIYKELVNKYYMISIEDGLYEEDWEGWRYMKERIGEKTILRGEVRQVIKESLIIGDDLLVTNVKRLKKAIAEKACNAAIVKLNQIGTLSETMDFIKLAKENNIKTIISHRSGETIDDFIADLAVAVGADFIKTGSLSRGERVCKYNRLLEIGEELKLAN